MNTRSPSIRHAAIQNDRYNRRALLKRLGLGAAMLPLLEAGRARGATLSPKRLVVVAWTNGVLANQFFPATPGALTANLPRCTAPLNDFRGDMIMLSGIDMKNFTAFGNHGAGHESFSSTFTGAKGKVINDGGPRFLGGSPSIDQYVAREVAKQVKLPFASVDLAGYVERYWHQSRCFYRGSDDPINGEQDPGRAFSTLFAGKPVGNIPVAGGMPTPVMPIAGDAAKVAQMQAERRSILDFVGAELESFGGRLGREDKARVQGHLQSVRELEQQIGGTASANPAMSATPAAMAPPMGIAPQGGAGCSAPGLEKLASSKANDAYPKVIEQHLDIIVHALKCDATRVATLMTHNGNGTPTSVNWLNVPSNVEFGAKNYHGLAHAGGDGKATIDTWFMERFALFLRKLKAVKEGDGTMLDNTVVLWANHFGNGGAHNVNDLPWILAGRGGDYFKPGRYIRKPGTPTNAILKALASSMGVSPTGFGDPMFGDELAELH